MTRGPHTPSPARAVPGPDRRGDPADGTSRRAFLRTSLAGVPAVLAAAGCQPADDDASYEPRFFSVAEWQFVSAAADRMIPADRMGPGALEAQVPAYIDGQMETPWGHGRLWYRHGPFDEDAPRTLGFQSPQTPRDIYRAGIAAADAAAQRMHGRAFAALPIERQDAFLSALERGDVAMKAPSAALFFATLLGNVREGFFSDPRHGGNRGLVGWTLIGFPGARADFMDWVERDVRYPLPPVAIDGSRGGQAA